MVVYIDKLRTENWVNSALSAMSDYYKSQVCQKQT